MRSARRAQRLFCRSAALGAIVVAGGLWALPVHGESLEAIAGDFRQATAAPLAERVPRLEAVASRLERKLAEGGLAPTEARSAGVASAACTIL